MIAVLAAVTAGSEAVKQLVARPRPPGFDKHGLGVVYSYPSGHVLEALTIYGIIAVLLWRSALPTAVRVALPLLFAALVVLVAIARVAVGAHYPSDVLAGLLGGIGVVALFAWVTGVLADRRASRQPDGPVRWQRSGRAVSDPPAPTRAFVIGRHRKGRPIADQVREVERLLAADGAARSRPASSSRSARSGALTRQAVEGRLRPGRRRGRRRHGPAGRDRSGRDRGAAGDRPDRDRQPAGRQPRHPAWPRGRRPDRARPDAGGASTSGG